MPHIIRVYIFVYINSQLAKTAMKVTLKINDQLIPAKKFATRTAAYNYIAKKEGRKMLHYQSHAYFVSI